MIHGCDDDEDEAEMSVRGVLGEIDGGNRLRWGCSRCGGRLSSSITDIELWYLDCETGEVENEGYDLNIDRDKDRRSFGKQRVLMFTYVASVDRKLGRWLW